MPEADAATGTAIRKDDGPLVHRDDRMGIATGALAFGAGFALEGQTVVRVDPSEPDGAQAAVPKREGAGRASGYAREAVAHVAGMAAGIPQPRKAVWIGCKGFEPASLCTFHATGAALHEGWL
ncbi:MAG: hypothetical protein KGR26_07850 [Cyanobacteria bacterium REEB65]|nr:hypothetical protein [Cyanobacteria bacterium REEB65]